MKQVPRGALPDKNANEASRSAFCRKEERKTEQFKIPSDKKRRNFICSEVY